MDINTLKTKDSGKIKMHIFDFHVWSKNKVKYK